MELRREVKLIVQKGKYGQSVSYTITLPKDYVEALGWKPGNRLEVVLDTENREIKVRKASPKPS